ncbi:MAG: AI-2E family transporter YdiK [Buchnera aphidicola (Eriosoma harunire)]
MYKQQEETNLIQKIFLGMFIVIMMSASFLIIYPFFLSLSWSVMIVISTWPLLLKLEYILGGKRILSVVVMIFLLFLLFFIPIIVLVNNVIDNSLPFINWLHAGNLQLPKLIWLKDIPVIGCGLFFKYQNLLKNEGSLLIAHIRPYMSYTSIFFLVQAGKLGKFVVHLICIVIFSGFLYWNGEKIEDAIRHFAFRLGSTSGHSIVLLAGKSIRSVALGIIVTSLLQIFLSGLGLIIFGIPYFCLFIILVIFFCLIQLGPLLALIPAMIWLFLNSSSTCSFLFVLWCIGIGMLDSILRPFLITMGGGGLPTLISVAGAIGGLLIFGMIGVFLGPVILVISYKFIIDWMNTAPISELLVDKSIKKNNKF